MSDYITCDVCRKSGRRRLFKHCPEGWFYGEYFNDEDPHSNTFIVSVCSKECANRFFVPGPGNLHTSPEYIIQRQKDET